LKEERGRVLFYFNRSGSFTLLMPAFLIVGNIALIGDSIRGDLFEQRVWRNDEGNGEARQESLPLPSF